MEVREAPVRQKCNQYRTSLSWKTLKCTSVGPGTSWSLPTSTPLPPSLPSFRSVFLFSFKSLFSPRESVPLFLFSLRRVANFISSPQLPAKLQHWWIFCTFQSFYIMGDFKRSPVRFLYVSKENWSIDLVPDLILRRQRKGCGFPYINLLKIK